MATILIVDDHPSNRLLLVKLLVNAKHRVLEASDGAEALALVRAERPQLVITDILMPTMDGFEFVRQLRSEASIADTPVIFSTAYYHQDQARKLAAACGVSHILTKPCKLEVVLRTVDLVLGSSSGAPVVPPQDFDREHLRVVTDELLHEADALVRSNQRLAALIEINLNLASERDVHRLLREFCLAARNLIGAKYGVVSVRTKDDADDCWVAVAGIETETAARLEALQSSAGAFADILLRREAYRLHDLQGDPAAAGLPLVHPPVHSFVAAPITSPSRVYGGIHLTNKLGAQEFSEEDERLLAILAAQMGRIYEDRRLDAEIQRHAEELQLEVTERKRTEGALRESQERNLAVVNTALDGIITIDHEGRIVNFNPAAEHIFGYRNSDVVGKDMAERLISPSLREQYRRGLARYLASGEGPLLGQRIELTALRSDGAEFPVELSITCNGSAEPATFTGFVRDITDRKQSEQERQAQLERLNLLQQITRAIGERQDLPSIFQVVIRSLEDQLPVDFGCVCLHDQPGNCLVVAAVGLRSSALATELAMAEQARVVIDDGLSRCARGQLVYEPDISQVAFPFAQRLAHGGLRSLVAAPLVVDGQVFAVLVAARCQPNGFSSGECEFLKQLSEHVALAAHQAQLYGALHQAYDDLRKTQRAAMQQERLSALGQMASGIAHDINNAISPVALYTESLLEKEPNLSAHTRSCLETIQRAIDDVAQTVARMREFYRQREPQIALAPVQLNRLVQQVIELTRVRWSDMLLQRGVVIRMLTELAPDLPAVMGIESEIREALVNLVFNAVDAMPDGGTLTLRTRVVQDAPGSEEVLASQHIDVEVVDTGVGMDEDTRGRCLEPFFTTKGERGTGLGLAMVYGVVQRHGADIEIESAPGQGTTMRLGFPITATPAVSAQPAAANAVPSHLRILVVDDDPMLLKSLHDALEAEGHAVVTANGGQAGIDAFRAARAAGDAFAVVITDLGMPYVDGWRVAAAVKQSSPSTPVILLTGWGQRLASNGDVPPHVDRVLSKPPRLRELREAFAHCCPSAQS